ncbi:AAA family ATPase [Rhizobium tumorigenes]|uniref:AAA family ATPase n=1 Tax=Rhizobium tumorigenes TaxID=2041385 RepID=A0AAF1K854_9HYPH|nr:AAA family ATPase [Rhizobium tumorigenes]WFR97565.1 AAA family ATPase [Rhizobium tumorigenes]
MHNFRFEKALKHKSVTLHVAVYGLARALRPFVHRPAVSFVAVLRVESPEDLDVYQTAAEYLLRLQRKRSINDFSEENNEGVEAFGDFADAVNIRRAQTLRYMRRTIVLHTGGGDIPGQVLMAADLVAEIEPPLPGHYLAAAEVTGLSGMTEADAGFLCGCSFYNVKLAFRSRRPLANGLRRLKTLAAELAVEEKHEAAAVASAPVSARRCLEEAVGYGEAKDWGLRVAEDLKAWSAGTLSWTDVDRGALLVGPPGSGKTSYASMLAASCGAALVTASAAKWQAMGHLGDLLKAMRGSFEEAMRQTPSILFLDEFDSLGSRDDDDGQNSNYARQVINGLLELLDGAIGHEGVVVVGATNYPDRIDPGLLRPGRLETHLVIPPLDGEARLHVLCGHIGIENLKFADGGFEVATVGWSGAQIEKLARDARRVARLARRPVCASDVEALLPERVPVPAEMLDRLAVHELGHAIVGVLVGQELLAVEIEDAKYGAGVGSFGRTGFQQPGMKIWTRSDYLDELVCYLAGMAAEQLVFGEHSDGAGGSERSDLARATYLATLIETHLAMGDVMVSEQDDDKRRLEMLRADPRRFAKIDVIIKEQMERARDMIAPRMDALLVLKAKLVERKRLEGGEVVHCLDQNQMCKA